MNETIKNDKQSKTVEKTESQIRKGVLELCVLTTLSHKPLYTANILNNLKKSGIDVVEGTLYPLLNRLKREGNLEYKWTESPSGPPRKYYSLTQQGKASLVRLNQVWLKISKSIKNLSNQ